MSQLKICRACGCSKLEQDLISDLASNEGEDTTLLRDYISYYCRINLSQNERLPTRVCRLCHMHLMHFIAFCDNLNKVEANFIIVAGKMIKQEEPTSAVKQETATPENGDRSEAGTSGVRNFRGKTPIQNVLDLFAEQLKVPFADQESHAHVTVDIEHVYESGEIASSWLEDFSVATWNDMSYKCQCKPKGSHKSLSRFLDHLKAINIAKHKINCLDCDKSYSALNSYINHVTKVHHEHLSFCCVECGKIHYNISALIKHYGQEHPNVANLYPCIECGYYAQSFTQLKLHVLSHKTQEISDSEDDEPKVKVAKNDAPMTSTPLSSLNYHPKAFTKKRNMQRGGQDPGQNRKTYPCDKCERVLLTNQGYIYHQLCHSNQKPYACRICATAFRSKQACNEHEKTQH